MRRAGRAEVGTLPAGPVCCVLPRGCMSAATVLSLGGEKPRLAEGLHLQKIKKKKKKIKNHVSQDTGSSSAWLGVPRGYFSIIQAK